MGRILVVDDDADLVATYELAIRNSGHDVEKAYSAAEARQKLQGDPPDAMVLDVMMERKTSGMDLAREVREKFPELPVIMLTSVHETVPASLRFEPDETWLPVTKFLDKPADPADLTREIDALLARRPG